MLETQISGTDNIALVVCCVDLLEIWCCGVVTSDNLSTLRQWGDDVLAQSFLLCSVVWCFIM